MKKLAIAALIFAAALSGADFSGIWNGKGGTPDAKYGMVPQTVQMTLLQAGTKLTGTIKVNNYKVVKLASGSVNGSQISIVAMDGKKQLTGQFSAVGSQLQGRITTSDGLMFNVALSK